WPSTPCRARWIRRSSCPAGRRTRWTRSRATTAPTWPKSPCCRGSSSSFPEPIPWRQLPRSCHAERGLVHLEDRFFLGDVVAGAFAQGDDLPHHLGVVAARLGLGREIFLPLVNVLLLGLELLEMLDELAQLVGRDSVGLI